MVAVYNTLFYLLLVPTTAGGLLGRCYLVPPPYLEDGWCWLVLAGAGDGTHFNAHCSVIR